MENFSTYLPGILLAYTAFLISIASPGPNVLAVIGTSMSVGRRQGLALGMGVAMGSFCWALLTVLGLSALLSAYSSALIVIKLLGGAYLLWLAFKAFRASRATYDLEAKALEGGGKSLSGYFARGYVIQMTNPKAALAWIAIISLGLSENAPFWVGAVIVAGTALLSIIIHCLYALAFSTLLMVSVYSCARRTIQLTLGAFFGLAGIKLLLSRN